MKEVNVYCDRCKRNIKDVEKEILDKHRNEDIVDRYMHMLPTYKIIQYAGLDRVSSERNIDLCCDCSKKLYNWIWKYPEGKRG